ncbi:hypothetical protein GCM10025331_47790 [Actinoplanes utahensis]|uniref:Uncharacterized protein n=2 Tax=Actinoplanes utahensis TaxID=1869 RepID=A0A0A6UEZ2_ACTUT|nr:hypothetical protein MB27_31140 [Actinoplanes utahensis]GIF29679.1 hypothetical protein Aut01nite_26650 [Actinoplanes utahensis]
MVHATTPIAGESVIVAKKSLDVLAPRFTFGYLPRRIVLSGQSWSERGSGDMKGDRPGADAARTSADRLALALEEAGFDVGQEFPALHDAVGRQGTAVVRVGDISPAVADRLSAVLAGVENPEGYVDT